jgi:hypothetical protein
MFKSGVTGLNRLLREWDVAARDGVEVGLDLRLHGKLQLVDGKLCFKQRIHYNTALCFEHYPV